MGLFDFYNNFNLMARNLTYLFTRVKFHMKDLDEETAFIIAARLNMNAYIVKGEINLPEIVMAYKKGTNGYCGLSPFDFVQHDYDLKSDLENKILRWVVQMEYLMCRIDIKMFSSDVAAKQVVDAKKHIVKGIRQVLENTDPNLNATRRSYEKVILNYKDSLDCHLDKVKIQEMLRDFN